MPSPKPLSEQDIRRAMKMTKSNMAAARYLNISLWHYKRYAKLYIDPETGENLYEIHKNQAGKGIAKFLSFHGKDADLEKLLNGEIFIESYSLGKFKTRLIQEGIIEECCNKCGFNEQRVLDYKAPLLIHFKDGNKKNWKRENLEFLCYNCFFLHVGDVFSQGQLKNIEDYHDNDIKTEEVDWEIDEYTREHWEKLGLLNEDSGSEDNNNFVVFND